MYIFELWTIYSEIQYNIVYNLKSQKEWHFRNFFKFLETMFIKINEQDLVRKIIKSGIMAHLKRIRTFSKWRRKNELFSTSHITHFFDTTTSILADLKYIIIFLKSFIREESRRIQKSGKLHNGFTNQHNLLSHKWFKNTTDLNHKLWACSYG